MTTQPCTGEQARHFDFWIGEWDLSWPAEQAGGEPGERMTGRNSISKMFGECIVEENFTTDDGRFSGHSVSAFDERAGLWRQTWVDSAGTYLSFSGGMEEGRMVLGTDPVEEGDHVIVNRMVFSDVRDDTLEWSWQRSTDGGTTWTDLWNISYIRR